MASIGQCKTCRGVVSTVAISCPHCGQPDPAIVLPAVGTICSATVERIWTNEEYYKNVGVVFHNGFLHSTIIIRVDENHTDFYVGKTMRVKIASYCDSTVYVSLVD